MLTAHQKQQLKDEAIADEKATKAVLEAALYYQNKFSNRNKTNIINLPSAYVGEGIIHGWWPGLTHPKPIAIELKNGQVFMVGGLSHQQIKQYASMSGDLLNHPVQFTHQGFNDKGEPMNPMFKTLIPSFKLASALQEVMS